MRPKKTDPKKDPLDNLTTDDLAALQQIFRENPDLAKNGPIHLIGPAEVTPFELGNLGIQPQTENPFRLRGGDAPTRSIRQEKDRMAAEGVDEAMFEAFRMSPFIGEAIDVAEIPYAAATGKDFYGEPASVSELTAMLAAGALIPNVIERGGRSGWRAVKRGLRKANDLDIDATVDALKTQRENITPFTPGGELDDLSYWQQIENVKNEVYSEEGIKRTRELVKQEAQDIVNESANNVIFRDGVVERAREVLDNPVELDRQVEFVFHGRNDKGNGFNDGYLNTIISPSNQIFDKYKGKRGYYSPAINATHGGGETKGHLRSLAEHEMAHSMQGNIKKSFGISGAEHASPAYKARGIESQRQRGIELDRDILRDVQTASNPNFLTTEGILNFTPSFRNARRQGTYSYLTRGQDYGSDVMKHGGHRYNEAYPMLVQTKNRLRQLGILPSRHATVTADMLEQLRQSDRIIGPIRPGVESITSFKDKGVRMPNYERMSELMNRMPILVPGLVGAGYLASQGGNQQQSGF